MNLQSLIDKIKWGFMLDLTLIDCLQILILTGVIFYLCKTLYRTRAWLLMKGLLIIGIVYLMVYAANMVVIQNLMESAFSLLVIAIVIMFQPDLQKLVESVGKRQISSTVSNIFKKQPVKETWIEDKVIDEIAIACEEMSKVKTGALIVIERGIPLVDYIGTGIHIGADTTNQLLINIFEKNTPLHDGAVVISNNKVEAATCYLPLTSSDRVDKHLGTRHRAAIGASENTDSVVIVVSEETGAISVCVDGKIKHGISKQELIDRLKEYSSKSEEKLLKKSSNKTPLFLKIASPIIAAGICIFIINVNDPVGQRTFSNVPVQIKNEEALQTMNQSYVIKSGETVAVTVKAHRSILNKLSTSDILAEADIEEMSQVYSVPIRVSMINQINNTEIVSTTQVMKLAVENLSSTELPIEIVVEGATADKMIAVGVNGSKTLTVTGTEASLKTLDKAIVFIDISSRTSDFVETCDAIILDKDGNEVSLSKFKVNTLVELKGTAYETKEVPIRVELSAQTDNADVYYELNSFSSEYKSVKIAAPDEVLSEIEALDLTVVPDAGFEAVTTLVFKLNNYLPDDVHLAPGQEEEITVSVGITKYQKVKLKLPKDKIFINGLQDKKHIAEVVKSSGELILSVNTAKIAIENVTIETLHPSITVNDTVGIYTATIFIDEIDGVTIDSIATVTYQITESEE